MDYQKEYLKYKKMYISMKNNHRQEGGFNILDSIQEAFFPNQESLKTQNNSDELPPNFTEFAINKFKDEIIAKKDEIKAAEEEIKKYKNLENIKRDNLDEYEWLIDKVLNDIHMEVDNDNKFFESLSPKLKAKIKKLRGVNELSDLKKTPNLEELAFGEFFTIDKKQIIEPGMLPKSLKKLEFYDFDNVIVKEGALPESLKDIYISPNVKIEGSLPGGLEKISVFDRKIKDYYQCLK